MTLGEQIKQARDEKKLSQEALAEQLGVSRQAVSKWETDASVPQGANRDMLSQILDMEFSKTDVSSDGNQSISHHIITWLGWFVAAALLFIGIWMYQRVRTDKDAPLQDNIPTKEDIPSQQTQPLEITESPAPSPAIKSVCFYDSEQNIVSDTALWYNSAEIESILVQWEGGSPDSIKLLFTPSGSDTLEQTELLLTKHIIHGDTAILLNADVLTNTQGHIYFTLDFGDIIIDSETFNLFYEPDFSEEAEESSTTLAFIKEFNNQSLSFDEVEWVQVPGKRAAELGLKENDSGFFIYNEDTSVKELPVSQGCVYIILDWNNSYTTKEVTLEELLMILEERADINPDGFPPYHLTVENDTIIKIQEQYVP